MTMRAMRAERRRQVKNDNGPLAEAVALRMIEFRVENDMNQVDLARCVGVSPNTILRLENRENGNLSTAGKVLDVVGWDKCLHV